MEMLTLEFVGTLRFQVAELLLRAAVEPSTAAVLPTNPGACVDCAVCCSETSVLSESLVLSCCSTCANCTSCWVNWLVSSGSSGVWFFSCVVSSVRKVWKLPGSVVLSTPVAALDDDAALLLLIAAVMLGETVGRMLSAIVKSSDANIDA